MLAGWLGIFSQEMPGFISLPSFDFTDIVCHCSSLICKSKRYIWLLQTLHSWPHYAVLVDEADDTGSHVSYVVQEQLELMKNSEVSVM
jgi:hypothetical protein